MGVIIFRPDGVYESLDNIEIWYIFVKNPSVPK